MEHHLEAKRTCIRKLSKWNPSNRNKYKWPYENALRSTWWFEYPENSNYSTKKPHCNDVEWNETKVTSNKYKLSYENASKSTCDLSLPKIVIIQVKQPHCNSEDWNENNWYHQTYV